MNELTHLVERIAVLETLLKNHLKTHDKWFWYVLIPILVATVGGRIHDIAIWLLR